jgi:hypothetical protein
MPTTLDEVRSYMGFLGWSDGGSPGSVKRDANGKVIAHYRDNAWMADIERACVELMRLCVGSIDHRPEPRFDAFYGRRIDPDSNS